LNGSTLFWPQTLPAERQSASTIDKKDFANFGNSAVRFAKELTARKIRDGLLFRPADAILLRL